MEIGDRKLRLISKQPEHPRCGVCNRYCNLEDIAEYIEAGKEISNAKVSAKVKRVALENLVASYNALCESKQPTLCVVCADSSTDIDERGLRLLGVAVIDGAYFDLMHGKGMNLEAADSFVYGSNMGAKNNRKIWHDIAGIAPPDDMEIEKRVTNWKQAHA